MRETETSDDPRSLGGRVHDRRSVADGRGTLSREKILQVALAIADRDGLAGLTIRKLAERLGVSPMGVYRYFRNKAEIVDGLVDVVVGEYEVTSHRETDWAEWVRETFRLMRCALRAHPGIITLLGTAASSGPNAMAAMEEVLRVLRGAGIDRQETAGAFHTLISYTIGEVAIQSHLHGELSLKEVLDPGERLRQSRLVFEAAPLPRYRSTVELAEHLALFGTEAEFMRGLDRVLAGLKVEKRVV